MITRWKWPKLKLYVHDKHYYTIFSGVSFCEIYSFAELDDFHKNLLKIFFSETNAPVERNSLDGSLQSWVISDWKVNMTVTSSNLFWLVEIPKSFSTTPRWLNCYILKIIHAIVIHQFYKKSKMAANTEPSLT